jgi:hypothetical protein
MKDKLPLICVVSFALVAVFLVRFAKRTPDAGLGPPPSQSIVTQDGKVTVVAPASDAKVVVNFQRTNANVKQGAK